jgi:CRP-like cAMP-binding protein
VSIRPSMGDSTQKGDNESIIAHFSDGLLINFTKDEIVISGIDAPEGVYLIKKGFIKAYSISKSGNSNLLLIHQVGEFIPLPWALDGAYTTGLYYEAMTDVTVLRASKDKLRSAMGKNSWLSQEVLKQSVKILGVYTNRIQTLEYRSARERVIAELLYFAERFGKFQGNKVIISAPITQQDIADSINMMRETASRAIGKLFDEKLVAQDGHLFTILDLPRLQAALS